MRGALLKLSLAGTTISVGLLLAGTFLIAMFRIPEAIIGAQAGATLTVSVRSSVGVSAPGVSVGAVGRWWSHSFSKLPSLGSLEIISCCLGIEKHTLCF